MINFLPKKVFITIMLLFAISILPGCASSSKENVENTESSEDDTEEKDDRSVAEKYSKKKNKGEKDIDVENIVIPDSDKDLLYADMEDYDFYFMSGAGAWETNMRIKSDGSFSGEYYDYDMGDTGPGYSELGTMYYCGFSGKFGEPVMTDYNCYTAPILYIDYENKPGTEEITDGQRKIYTEPYGLSETDEIYIYAPQMSTGLLPEGYKSWVYWAFYDAEEGDAVFPVEMPFYGIYNPVTECGFYSESLLVNRYIISNTVKFPGIVNDYSDCDYMDRTYDIEDTYPGEFVIRNICFFDREDPDTDYYADDRQEFVKNSIGKIVNNIKGLNIYGSEEDEWMHDQVTLNGEDCLFAVWQSKSAGKMLDYSAKILRINNFVYVYAIGSYPDSWMLTGEAKNFFMSGLTLYSPESSFDYGTSSGTKGTVNKKIMALVSAKKSDDGQILYLSADEVDLVTDMDKELLDKYGITPEDMDGDYEIMGEDGVTVDYRIADTARFFVQYETDPIYNPIWPDHFVNFLNSERKYIMVLYLDDSDNIVFGYEPYIP